MIDPNPLHAIAPAFLAAVQPLFVIVVLLGTVGIVLRLLARDWRRGRVPAVVARPLLTQAELRFYHVLADALPGYFIASQVSMGALLRPEKGLEGRDWWATYGRFSQKIVDFVVIDRGTGSVVALVELDDRSHDAAKDAARDAMVRRAGYVVIRFANRPWPTAVRVRERFADLDILVASHPSPTRVRSVS